MKKDCVMFRSPGVCSGLKKQVCMDCKFYKPAAVAAKQAAEAAKRLEDLMKTESGAKHDQNNKTTTTRSAQSGQGD